MKKSIILVLGLAFLLTMVATPASADMKKLAQSGMTFLGISGSARAAAMANAFSFAQGDLATVTHNPAGLATVEDRAVYFNWTSWIADMTVTDAAVSWEIGSYGVFALTARIMDYGDIPGTVIDETSSTGFATTGTLDNVSGMAVGIAYGRKLTDRFAIGGGLKMVRQQLGNNDTYRAGDIDESLHLNKTDAFALDFGTSYDTGIRSLRLTMAMRNYAPQQLYENEEFSLPLTYRIGLSGNLSDFVPFTGGLEGLIVAIEGIDANDRSEYVNVGAEYQFQDLLALRAGYGFNRQEDKTGGLAAGAGIMLDKMGFGGSLDFSYSDFGGVFGSVMRMSLSASF